MKMQLFENRGKFFDRLWLDYQEYKQKLDGKTYKRSEVRECFIFQYYTAKKVRTARHLAKDINAFNEFRDNFKRSDNKLVLLYAARLLLKRNKISTEDYRAIFKTASKNVYSSKDIRADPDSDEAFEQIAYLLVSKYVNKIFLDNGYHQRDYDNDGTLSRREPEEDSDKLEDIEMMYLYSLYIQNDGVYTERPGELSEEFEELCGGLLNALRSAPTGQGDAFFPLYIDPLSGAGIYIIGDHLVGRLKSDGCSVYTSHFASIAPNDNMFAESDKEEDVYWAYNMTKFDSVEAAFEDFESDTLTLANRRYKGYIDYNVDIPIKTLEKDGFEQFLRYKDIASDIDHQMKLSTQERQRITKILKKEAAQKAKEKAEAQMEERRRGAEKRSK